jgi:phosphoglycolate phosphatase
VTARKRFFVLWDVDHTLIDNGGMSKIAYADTFRELVGVGPTVQPSTDGRTDIEIMQNLITANGVDASRFSVDLIRECLVRAMQRNSATLMERGHMLPGVADAIRTVDREISAVQSVLTGNLAENSALKLRLIGDVVKYLDVEVGGYGSDDIVRSNLVKIAQDRAGAKYRVKFSQHSTVLVGDTARDVAAGLVGGASVVGVASGVTSMEDLEAAGARRVLPDLTDADAVVSALREVLGADDDTPTA